MNNGRKWVCAPLPWPQNSVRSVLARISSKFIVGCSVRFSGLLVFCSNELGHAQQLESSRFESEALLFPLTST
jgi:hypothetical protein